MSTKTFPINASKLSLAEYTRTIHSMTPDAGAKLDDVMEPGFYRHVAVNFKPMDRIEVMPADGAWYAELMVMFVSKNEVRVTKLTYLKLDKVSAEDAENSDYEVKYVSPSVRFCVINKKTGDRVKDGFDTKELAAAYMVEHTKALAA